MKILYNKMIKKPKKALMVFEPSHNGKKNGFSAGSGATY